MQGKEVRCTYELVHRLLAYGLEVVYFLVKTTRRVSMNVYTSMFVDAAMYGICVS
jgi:hypothetical protein